jgi:hypothetical protein
MSGATDTLDPVEAAEDDIAGSKDLIASVADEISQHQRWLENYRVSETKRARRLKRQELMYQLDIRRRRTIRSAKRFALASLILARRVASFLVRNGTALLVTLRRLLARGAAWTAPRARALALTLWRWSSAAVSWTRLKAGILARACLTGASITASWIAVKSRALALTLRRWLSAAYSWTLVEARMLARALLRAASISASWIAVKSRVLALALRQWLAEGFAWMRVETRILANRFLRAASMGFAWIVLKASALSSKLSEHARHGAKRSALATRRWLRALISNGESVQRRMRAWAIRSPVAQAESGVGPEPQTECGHVQHEASAEKHSTALVCIEPWRARLPVVVRASSPELGSESPGVSMKRKRRPRGRRRGQAR